VAERRQSTIRDLLAQVDADEASSRGAELAKLLACLQEDGPVVAWVHGASGTDKLELMNLFETRASASGAIVNRMDCRMIEPTEAGLLAALGEQLEQNLATTQSAARALADTGARAVIVFENYEVFRLLDTWLRREFIPSLDYRARVVLSSSEEPAAGWLSSQQWRPYFVAIPLDPLPGSCPEQRAASLLDAVSDTAIRSALESLSVVRRITRPMLASLCPDTDTDELYDALAALPFVESRRDGLALEEQVHRFLGRRLQASDPQRYRLSQQAAWRVLRHQLRAAPRADLWRFTADVIYLIENPVIREAFFPSEAAQFAVEPAMPGDIDTILAMTERHDGEPARGHMALWWKHLPGAFHIVRDSSGEVQGFYCMATPDELGAEWLRFDPVARNWQRHLFSKGATSVLPSLFLRRWLSVSDGEAPSPEQAAAWVDVKRTYLELRPGLRRVYLTLRDIGPYGPVATELGFKVLDDLAAEIDNVTYHSAMLDFGPGSVDGWICDMVAAELGIDDAQLLDPSSRELRCNGNRISLTPLEFGVVSMLESRAGEAVTRDELLRQVWGHGHDGGSNVVDAVIRGLRRKCGDDAGIFETVRGVGYRLRV
jgi:hypothetical protein